MWQLCDLSVSKSQEMLRLRTFQLSKAFLPVETPVPVQALGLISAKSRLFRGQSLQDGIPLVIVTRGCFGREMDIGP